MTMLTIDHPFRVEQTYDATAWWRDGSMIPSGLRAKYKVMNP